MGNTSGGGKFALEKVLSLNLNSVPDQIVMSILRGRCGMVQLSPGLKFSKLRRYSRDEI